MAGHTDVAAGSVADSAASSPLVLASARRRENDSVSELLPLPDNWQTEIFTKFQISFVHIFVLHFSI